MESCEARDFFFWTSIYWSLEELQLKTLDCSLNFSCLCTSMCVLVIFVKGCWWGRRRGQTGGVRFYKWGRKCLYPRFGHPHHFPYQSLPVCVLMCVCVVWTRHWLSPIPSSVSLTGPSRRAASLFPPDGTTAQLTPPQPCQHNPRLRPTICSPDPDGGEGGEWLKKKEESKDNKKETKERTKMHPTFLHKAGKVQVNEWVSLKG